MAEGSAGLTKFHPDGTVGITVDGRRHTLRVPTLGDLEDLRSLFRDLSEELEDYRDLEFRPGVIDLKAKVKESTEATERKAIRKELRTLEEDQDRRAQDAWATWWRECFDRLSRDPLPEFDERPAEALPLWMIESPDGIGPMFRAWRSTPTEASGRSDLTALLQGLTDPTG